MDLRQLEAFAAVMSAGSITGAAGVLARSQPVVTRQVQELEGEIGYALFHRHGPRVTPTEQGFALFEDVQRVLGDMRRIRERAAEIGRGDDQPLRLAATSALALGLLPQALVQAGAAVDRRPVQVHTASPEQVIHAVLSGNAQLGLCSLPMAHQGLQIHWIGEAPCLAVLPQGDPLAQHDTVPLAALAQRRLVVMSNPYRLRHGLDSALARAGIRQPAQRAHWLETNSSVNAQALVRAGLGVAVLEPLTVTGLPLDGLVLRPLDVHIPFLFGVISSQGRSPSPAAQAVIDALRQVAADLPGFAAHEAQDHGLLLRRRRADGAPPPSATETASHTSPSP